MLEEGRLKQVSEQLIAEMGLSGAPNPSVVVLAFEDIDSVEGSSICHVSGSEWSRLLATTHLLSDQVEQAKKDAEDCPCPKCQHNIFSLEAAATLLAVRVQGRFKGQEFKKEMRSMLAKMSGISVDEFEAKMKTGDMAKLADQFLNGLKAKMGTPDTKEDADAVRPTQG